LAERRLAFLGSTGVGKTTVVNHLVADPRLSAHLIVDIDFFFSKSIPQEQKEAHAIRTVLAKEVDVVFGVMTDADLRALLAERGFSFVVLSLPESEHRARLAKRVAERGGLPMSFEASIFAQRHLESLGYESVDANRPVEEIARDMRSRVVGLAPGRRLAVLGAPGVGKSTLCQRLRADLALMGDSSFKSKLILNSEPFLSRAVGAPMADATAGEAQVDGWRPAELHAVRAAMEKKVDVLFGLMRPSRHRALLEKNGFEFVVLTLPESLHRQRMERRFWERGKVVDIEGSIKRQRKLESLGYESIDASRPPDVVADDVVQRVLGPGGPSERRSAGHSSGAAPLPLGKR
jgi:adenylate kinase family enzyme